MSHCANSIQILLCDRSITNSCRQYVDLTSHTKKQRLLIVSAQMEPYAQGVPKQYLPICCECRKCSNESLAFYSTESSRNPNPVVTGAPRPFTIDYLLGEKHQKPLKEPSGVLFTVGGGFHGPFDSELFASFRRENFEKEKMAFPGNIRPDGELEVYKFLVVLSDVTMYSKWTRTSFTR